MKYFILFCYLVLCGLTLEAQNFNIDSISFYRTVTGGPYGIAVSGNFIYFGNFDAYTGSNWIEVVDISDPSNPTYISSVEYSRRYNQTSRNIAWGVLCHNPYLYVAAGDTGLVIINISDPYHPYVEGYYNTPGQARDVKVRDSYAYVADDHQGLRIINVSIPSMPIEVGFIDTPGRAWGIDLSGNYAYIGDGIGGFHVTDISQPQQPNIVASILFMPSPREVVDISIYNTFAYVAVDRSVEYPDLYIIDISNPLNPDTVGKHNFTRDERIRGVAIPSHGFYAFCGCHAIGHYVVDVANPSQTTEVGHRDFKGSLFRVATQGNYIYQAVEMQGILICKYTGSIKRYSYSPFASAFNQPRHIVRQPNTQNLHLVYENNTSIMYSKSTNWGQTWSTPTYVDSGSSPAIALGSGGNTPWIFYADLDLAGAFRCAVRRPNGTWKIRTIFEGKGSRNQDYNVGPSLMLAIMRTARPDLGYAVFSDNYERIFFVAFDTVRNYCTQVLDEQSNYHYCLAPSISITPGDFLHVVWQRDIGNEGKIFYRTTEKVNSEDVRAGRPPNWSGIIRISSPDWPQTEPASNPSVEAYGEYVYAAWRGPNNNGVFPGDIWRRARKITWLPSVWQEPRNMSNTLNKESNYPVMYTNFATVWQESILGTNWDIWGNIGSFTGRLFGTPTPSKYPHIDGNWDPRVNSFYCNTIWTEQPYPNLYEIRYGRYQYQLPDTFNEKTPLYYTVDIGKDTASPYCLERDGKLTYGSYSLDYADEDLKYKLPYLNPQYSYLLRAIVYRTGVGNWIEDIYIDSSLIATILSEPYVPETVWITLPKEFYEYDTEIENEVDKIIGRRALIADLRIYQVESIDSTGGGSGPQSAGSALIQKPILYQSAPNPAKTRTVIRYSLPTAGKVSLQLYNISGRLVKTLVDEYKNPGSYSITLNSKSASGGLSAGVYFYRLKTNGFSNTKRLVLIR